jgi:hypothetical protein
MPNLNQGHTTRFFSSLLYLSSLRLYYLEMLDLLAEPPFTGGDLLKSMMNNNKNNRRHHWDNKARVLYHNQSM